MGQVNLYWSDAVKLIYVNSEMRKETNIFDLIKEINTTLKPSSQRSVATFKMSRYETILVDSLRIEKIFDVVELTFFSKECTKGTPSKTTILGKDAKVTEIDFGSDVAGVCSDINVSIEFTLRDNFITQ